MAQKLFEPFRKIPQQFQNLNIVQKLHDFTAGRCSECFGTNTDFYGGCLKSPTAMTFDGNLGLLALGTESGVIKIYGSPGTVFPVHSGGPGVVSLSFIPYEVRLLSAFLDGQVTLFDFMESDGSWKKCCSVRLPLAEKETVTSMAIGRGVVYVGSSTGTLRQIAVKDGRLSLADDVLTACTRAMLSGSVTSDKSEQLNADSPIVSLEMQPNGDNLLVAYADGCVAIAIPQPFPQPKTKLEDQPPASGSIDVTVAPTAEAEVAITSQNGDEPASTIPPTPEREQPTNAAQDGTGPPTQLDTGKSSPANPVKSHSDKRATLKLRTLTRTWRATAEKSEAESSLPVPPSPQISHLLLRDQTVEYATWRQLSSFTQPDEVVVAYGDGAFQVWPVCSAVDTIDDLHPVVEPLIVSKRDPPNMPYGPLPCGAIRKMSVCPSAAGGVLTAFSGGLPRPEFEERHAVSVLLGQEHHVCFQFGSAIKDFLFIPAKKELIVPETAIDPVQAFAPEPAAALLVLTERELVAIDLMQPTWPTFPAPYLTCLDASPVTALAHVNKVPLSIISANKLSWPIWGGPSTSVETDERMPTNPAASAKATGDDLVLLGHSDGSISLLVLQPGDCTYLTGRVYTHSFFQPADEKVGAEEESWPPFRRVGMCIPPPGAVSFSDPRLSIAHLLAVVDQHTSTDSTSGGATLTIVVGGVAGQVTVMSTAAVGQRTAFQPYIDRISVNLIESETNSGRYMWAGSLPLKPFEGPIQLTAAVPYALNLSPCALIQVEPATAVTAMAWETSWHLAAVGTTYGFAVVDMLAKCPVHTDLLLNKLATAGTTALATAAAKTVNSVATMQTAIAQRGKQLTLNMRQSFRRLKQLRTSTSTADHQQQEEAVDGEHAAVVNVSEQQQQQPEGQPDSTGEADVAQATTAGSTEGTGINYEPAKLSGDTNEKLIEKTATADSEETGEVAAASVEKEPTVTLPEPVIVLTDSSALGECHNAVRSFLFTDTFFVTPTPGTAPQRSPSLWVGTSSGRVLAHCLDWLGSAGPVTLRLVKELQLQHQAPVIAIAAVDAISRAPVGDGERTRQSHEPAITDVKTENGRSLESPAPAATEEQAVEPLGASPEQVSPPSSAPVESHQIIVCSTEQIKLFALPTLRALHKHKLVPPTTEQRLRLTHLLHSASLGKPAPATAESNVLAQAAPTTPQPVAVGSITEDVDKEQQQQPETDVEQLSTNENNLKAVTQSSPTVTAGNRQMHRKSLTCVALQHFTKACGTGEWFVVAARRDGKVVILSLPTLRRQFKATSAYAATVLQQQRHADVGHVSKASANIAMWWSATTAAPLVALDLSSSPQLTPKAVIVGEAGTGCLPVPWWARPRKPSNVVKADAKNETKASPIPVSGDGRQDASLIGGHGVVDARGDLDAEGTEAANGCDTATTVEPVMPSEGESVTAVGDVTIDTIKEYLNGDDRGHVTVKTIERSTEKHTLVEAGRVVTTLHETETVDGKVVKDDLVKITSDDPSGDTVVLQAVTGSP